MYKRFIVLLNDSTAEQNDSFLEWIKEEGIGSWHWLSNSWLLATSKGHLSAQDIRDKLMETYPGVHNMVVEISANGDTWSGFGPKGENNNMFKWIHENWKNK